MTTLPEALVAAPTAEESQGDRYRPIEWNICKRLFHYMWRYPRTQIFICICAITIAAIHSLTPLVITETIRRTIERPELWTEPTGLTPLQGVITGAGLVALLAVSYYIVMRVRMRLVSRLAEHVVYDLRHDIFSHVQRLDMAYFDRTKLGRILSRGTSDVAAVRNAVAEIVPRTLIHGLMMVGLFIIMLTFDWVLALILLAMAPVLWFVSNIFRRRMGHAYRAVQESFSRLTANIAESIAGIRVTQAFSREQRNDELFRNLCLTHRARNMSAARIHGVYIPLFEVSSQLIAAIIVIVGGYRVANGYMDVSDLIGFLLCTGGFFISIIILAELYNTTLQAMAGGERIFALLDTEPHIHDAADARDLVRTSSGARVEFDGVTFGYDPERPVLRDISFTAEPGHVVALVGHTGSGKTSIVSLITRLYAHQQGDIRIDDEPIQQLTLHSLHRQVGLVLQDNFLFTGTVAQNIRFARPDASDDQVREACQALDCLDVLEALPEGLETQVGERGSALSLGQRQLVCFARAMIADPRLLMLDEATSAVDTFTEYRIQRALERLMADRTSIVVAHRLSTVRRANQILVLEAGQIIERGDHDTLMTTGGHYSTLYNEFIRLSSE